jgi:hypothetical protein
MHSFPALESTCKRVLDDFYGLESLNNGMNVFGVLFGINSNFLLRSITRFGNMKTVSGC